MQLPDPLDLESLIGDMISSLCSIVMDKLSTTKEMTCVWGKVMIVSDGTWLVSASTAGLALDVKWGLRWHSGCQCPISIPSPDSESRQKNYTDIFQRFFGKTRIEFSDFFVSTLWCNIYIYVYIYIYIYIYIYHGLHQPWWRCCCFMASRSPMVANEDVLESLEPPGSRATITIILRGR